MTYTQIMYRRYPKRQDHGTRGSKSESLLQWGNFKKGLALSRREFFKAAKRKFKVELNKLSIDCTDEDIEKYLLKTQHRLQDLWFEFV